MTDSLIHWVRTQQDANVPLVQLQDPTVTRGTGILVVTDEQRVALWSAANREHDRLQRGVWYDKWWGRAMIGWSITSSLAGLIASVDVIIHH